MNAIYVIVDNGKAEFVIEAAKKGGARGGTVINSKGFDLNDHNKQFLRAMEPEKEFVLIVADNNLTESITSSIREDLKIEEPVNGLIFVQDVNESYGF
jgi:nitrogen regulatory protein PII